MVDEHLLELYLNYNLFFLPPEGEVLVRGVGLCCNFFGMIQKTSTYIDILYTKMIL